MEKLTKTILSLLLPMLLGACTTLPRRLVVQNDPEVSTAVIEAVDEFEEILGCRIWKSVEVGGKPKDWRGLFPPFGTTTLRYDPIKVAGGKDGFAEGSMLGRTRIYFPVKDPHPIVVIHEFLHSMGFDHDSAHSNRRGIMYKSGAPRESGLRQAFEDAPVRTRARIYGLCLEEE